MRPLAVDEPRVDESTRRLTVPVSGGVEVLQAALHRLDGNTTDVFDVGLRRPDLDDVFLALTGHVAEEKPTATDQEPHPVPAAGSAR
jgi:ABC-2 type transport system ATP-binding protein